MTEQPAEQVLFSEGNVKITTTRAIFDDKTYAMSSIASVSMTKYSLSKLGPALTTLLGVLILLTSVFAFQMDFDNEGIIVLLVGIALTGAGVYMLSRKPAYIASIESSSGRSDAIKSNDEDTIRRIVQAINDVIVQRG